MLRRYDGRILLVDTQRDPFAFVVGITRYFTVFLLGSGWTVIEGGRSLRWGGLVIDLAGHDLKLCR